MLTSAIGASVATAAMAAVVSPWYMCALIPFNAVVTWFFPQYAPITAAVGTILGTLTGPYAVDFQTVLPLQASILIGAACSHYVFHMEGKKASVAALGATAIGTAAVFSGMHKMFYPLFGVASVQIVGTALQNYHVASVYGSGRRVRSDWYRKVPPGAQQAFFGFMILCAMLLGRRYSHRTGLIIRERETDSLDLDKRESALKVDAVGQL